MANLLRLKALVVGWALLAGAVLSSLSAQGQCSCTTTLTNTDTTPTAGSIVCIPAGLTYTATLTLSNDNVTVCNSGTISGTIRVTGNGAVINNLGSIPTPNIFISKAATLNNGSSNGGTTVFSTATWSGYLGGNITAAPLINNYATWTAQMQPLPGGTINNKSGAIWNMYLTTNAALTVVNAGTWMTQIQESVNSPTISITQNAGSWTGALGGGSGSLLVTNNAIWTVGFNFPTGGNNAFKTASGATTTFNSYLGLNGTVVLTDNGTMNVNNGMATLSSTSSLNVAVGSTFSLGNNDLNNQGTVVNRGTITAANSTNSGSLIAAASSILTLTGGLTNQAPGTLQNSGTISSNNFTNSATITGPLALPRGKFKASGYTVNSGNFGADGSYLDFCDSTPPTPASQGFDSRGGTIGKNVTFCAPAVPLPVTLTYFVARWQQGQVVVNWSTASELNSAQFVVERSADSRQFEAIQTVAGQGTTSQTYTYTATDAAPLTGSAFYRLQQLDWDGTRTYSPVVRLLPPVGSSTAQPVCYPNPTTGATLLDLVALPTGDYEVRIMNTLGKLVYYDLASGGQQHHLSLDSLPAGTYLLRVGSLTRGYAVQRLVKN